MNCPCRENEGAEIMKILFAIILPVILTPFLSAAEIEQTNGEALFAFPKLSRHYQEGELLAYHMKASNRGFFSTTSYEADTVGVVKKDSNGHFFEEFFWTNLVVDAKNIALPAVNPSVRQTFSLDPDYGFSGFPDLAKVHPKLVGPMLDLFNFYVDLQLAMRQTNLTHIGDRVFLKYSKPGSWAHGSVVLGEDSIDFDITVKAIDRNEKSATILVRHVPSANPEIRIPADWMRAPVLDTPNNWVQVTRNTGYQIVVGVVAGICVLILLVLFRFRNSRCRWTIRASFLIIAALLFFTVVAAPYFRYVAMVGKETFDVELKVDLDSGKILSASMDNPVELIARPCANESSTKFGPGFRGHFKRQIEVR
jgi:membrane protein YdbS with pleckstrin-like domain